MTSFFLLVYDYFSRRKRALFVILTLLIALFAFSAYHIRFQEDISRFLPADKENERIANAYQYVVSSNTIIVYCRAVDSVDFHETQQADAIDALAERLQAKMDSSYIKSLFYKVDPVEMMTVSSFIVENMPYFLDADDYRRMDTLLLREAVTRQLFFDKEILASEAGMIVRRHLLSDPLQITAPLMRKLQTFKIGDQFHLYDDHLFTDDHRGLLFIECALPSSETKANAVFLDSLRLYMAETEKAFDGVAFDSFGASEIAIANARQIQRDTLFSISLAVVVMFAFLIYVFRSGRKIALIFASVLFGGLFALALLNIISGDVSVIAVGISSIMFGIAINYPLHFIEHHNHVAHSRLVIKDIIEPLTIGNLTTVGAFASLIFIGSDAMSDLGLFASLLLVGTIFFVLLFLPHLLPCSSENLSVIQSLPLFKVRKAYFSAGWRKTAKWFYCAVVALTIVFAFLGGDSRFDTDMQSINYMTDAQKKSFNYMMNLLNKNRRATYLVTEGATPDAALEANENHISAIQSLVDDGYIQAIGGIGGFLPSKLRQAERLRMWNDFWDAHRDSVMTYLGEASRQAGFKDGAFKTFEETVARQWTTVNAAYFKPVSETLAKNYVLDKNGKTMVVNLLYADPSSAVQTLEKQISERAPSAIVFDAGSITRRMIATLSNNFNYVLYVCGFIVFAFLVFSLGRIELSVIAFVPLALSWVWILGMMSVFDIRFNIVNIILATFIFGQGDDYTIFMTEGLMYEYAYRRKMLASYRRSIALSALIMFVGMGMLIFAKHPALRSLAEVTMIGMLSVVVMSYIFPPLLFRLLTLHKGNKRMMPLTLKNLFCFVYAFLFFVIMSLIITIIGWATFTFGRTTERKKLRYHRLLCGIARFVIVRIPQVKTTFRNLSGESFEKPGVIICNHQSHLDLMCVMMLAPKLIILTNDWVWNSPFYGRLIKYADYYPISNGIENALGRLRDAVERGYSIVVFPEGTRSADCSIRRFHRGAFYLAAQLRVDVIPVLIHGAGHVLPKNEFMLRKGSIHIQVMPRITLDDTRFGVDYPARATAIRHYYKEEYQKLCRVIETPDYYADLVIHNYIYKGATVEREVRRNLRRNGNYASAIARQPDEGVVVVENSGYGEYPLLLALVKKRLQVIAIEPDPDKRELATNCVSLPPNLEYRDAASQMQD